MDMAKIGKIGGLAEAAALKASAKAAEAAEGIKVELGEAANRCFAEAAMIISYLEILAGPSGKSGRANLAKGKRAFASGNSRPKGFQAKVGEMASAMLGGAYNQKDGDAPKAAVRKVLDIAAGFAETHETNVVIQGRISGAGSEDDAVRVVAEYIGQDFQDIDSKGEPRSLESRAARLRWARGVDSPQEVLAKAFAKAEKAGLTDAEVDRVLESYRAKRSED